jgi:arylsulfatase A-like enzyme
MEDNSADLGLTRPTRSWGLTPLWAMLGIALPLTFLAELRSTSMSLRYAELIPLYATEWICFGIIGICASTCARIVDAIISGFWRGAQKTAASRGAFAMVVGAATAICLQAWIESFGRGASELKWWHILILAALLVAGIGSSFDKFLPILWRLRSLAFPISLVGGLCLLSAVWVHFPASITAGDRLEVGGSSVVRPNIVLISIDALAASHLTPYGSSRPTSPNIAALAARSIVFDRFYAVGNFTTTGVSTILTGVMPWTHRALQLLGRPTQASISQSLPARLHSAGYTTAYFASNPWAGATRQGVGPYFDHKYSGVEWETAPCLDRLADRFPFLCVAAANPFVSIVFKTLIRTVAAAGVLNVAGYADPAEITAAAAQWLSQPHASPLFMWVHYLPPHDPYAAPPPWLGRFDGSPIARSSATSHPPYLFRFASESKAQVAALEARYDESVSYVDSYVGRLIAVVRAKLGPNTAIVLTADHGESFSHGYGGHGGVMLYEDLIHIPLILSLPAAEAEFQHRPELSDQSDLAPTIAAIAGVYPSASWDGVSLLNPQDFNDKRTIFAMDFEQNRSRERLSTGSVAALNGVWKLTRFLGSPRYPGMPMLKTQLFNIGLDPLEKIDVANDHPDTVAQLSTEIDEKLERYGGPLGK